MKLSKERISHMADVLISRLQREGFLDLLGDKQSVVQTLDRTITYELQAEDRLNAEVRKLMQAYQTEIETGHVDYEKMFSMIKGKLVKDRGLIL